MSGNQRERDEFLELLREKFPNESDDQLEFIASITDRAESGPLLDMPNVSISDFMWNSKKLSSVANESLKSVNGQRGTAETFGESIFACPKCKQKQTVMRTVQIRSGDEGSSMMITCIRPQCGHKYILN